MKSSAPQAKLRRGPARALIQFGRAVTLSTSLALLVFGCHDGSPSPTAGSNSNWLTACATNADCAGTTSCQCGGCTRACALDPDCAALPGARCVAATEPALDSQCAGSAASSLCLPACTPGSCELGYACVAEACVLAPLTGSAFCGPSERASQDARRQEEELLDAVTQLRLAGGVSCGGGSPSTASSAPRFNASLQCAARVLADDMNSTRTRSLTDSQGRVTLDRMHAAGYAGGTWAEAFALGASSAADALTLMLADVSACDGLTGSRLRDIGLGLVGDTWVVTLGAP